MPRILLSLQVVPKKENLDIYRKEYKSETGHSAFIAKFEFRPHAVHRYLIIPTFFNLVFSSSSNYLMLGWTTLEPASAPFLVQISSNISVRISKNHSTNHLRVCNTRRYAVKICEYQTVGQQTELKNALLKREWCTAKMKIPKW